MMRNNPLSILSGIVVVLISIDATALGYVPPPGGPYKSSSVITSPSIESKPITQVYRFPPEDLIQKSNPVQNAKKPMSIDEPQVRPFRDLMLNQSDFPQNFTSQGQPTAPQAIIEDNNGAGSQPGNKATENPFYPPLQDNPWAVGSQEFQNTYPNQWNGQNNNYNYPKQYQDMNPFQNYQQNSNQYSNQYTNPNNMNTPFSAMPSPWQMMPMQPFFPGTQSR